MSNGVRSKCADHLEADRIVRQHFLRDLQDVLFVEVAGLGIDARSRWPSGRALADQHHAMLVGVIGNLPRLDEAGDRELARQRDRAAVARLELQLLRSAETGRLAY